MAIASGLESETGSRLSRSISPRIYPVVFLFESTLPSTVSVILSDLGRFIIIIFFSGVRLSPLGTAASISLLYQPRMIDNGDCGAVGGMNIGRGNRSTRRIPVPVPFCPPHIPHDLTRARTWAAAVGSQRLATWAMARPWLGPLHHKEKVTKFCFEHTYFRYSCTGIIFSRIYSAPLFRKLAYAPWLIEHTDFIFGYVIVVSAIWQCSQFHASVRSLINFTH
jgi:hypothetical protein